MRRIIPISAAALFLVLTSVAGQAAPSITKQTITANPSIISVQGWWEQEHRERRAREGYWRLPSPDLDRYNSLQAEIIQLQEQRREIDERLRRALYEQHRMLGFGAR